MSFLGLGSPGGLHLLPGSASWTSAPCPSRTMRSRCCQTGWCWNVCLGTASALPAQRAPRYPVPMWAPGFQPGPPNPPCTPRGLGSPVLARWVLGPGFNAILAKGGSWVGTAHPGEPGSCGDPQPRCAPGCWLCHGAFLSGVPLGPGWTCSSSCANRIWADKRHCQHCPANPLCSTWPPQSPHRAWP